MSRRLAFLVGLTVLIAGGSSRAQMDPNIGAEFAFGPGGATMRQGSVIRAKVLLSLDLAGNGLPVRGWTYTVCFDPGLTPLGMDNFPAFARYDPVVRFTDYKYIYFPGARSRSFADIEETLKEEANHLACSDKSFVCFFFEGFKDVNPANLVDTGKTEGDLPTGRTVYRDQTSGEEMVRLSPVNPDDLKLVLGPDAAFGIVPCTEAPLDPRCRADPPRPGVPAWMSIYTIQDNPMRVERGLVLDVQKPPLSPRNFILDADIPVRLDGPAGVYGIRFCGPNIDGTPGVATFTISAVRGEEIVDVEPEPWNVGSAEVQILSPTPSVVGEVRVGSAGIPEGGVGWVPVTLRHPMPVEGFALTLRWNPFLVSIDEVMPGFDVDGIPFGFFEVTLNPVAGYALVEAFFDEPGGVILDPLRPTQIFVLHVTALGRPGTRAVVDFLEWARSPNRVYVPGGPVPPAFHPGEVRILINRIPHTNKVFLVTGDGKVQNYSPSGDPSDVFIDTGKALTGIATTARLVWLLDGPARQVSVLDFTGELLKEISVLGGASITGMPDDTAWVAEGGANSVVHLSPTRTLGRVSFSRLVPLGQAVKVTGLPRGEVAVVVAGMARSYHLVVITAAGHRIRWSAPVPSSPDHIFVDPDRNIWVTSTSAEKAYKFSSFDGTLLLTTTAVTNPGDLSLGSTWIAGSIMTVTGSPMGVLYKVDDDGKILDRITLPLGVVPGSVSVDGEGILWVTDLTPPGDRVFLVDPSTGEISEIFAPGTVTSEGDFSGTEQTVLDPDGDADGDGVSNWDEIVGGTNPFDAGSAGIAPVVELAWFPAGDRDVRLVWGLGQEDYTAIEVVRDGTAVTTVGGQVQEYTESDVPGGVHFYQVIAEKGGVRAPPAEITVVLGAGRRLTESTPFEGPDGFFEPFDVTFGDDQLFATDLNYGVIEVFDLSGDAASGFSLYRNQWDQIDVSSILDPDGLPMGVAYEPTAGNLYVLDGVNLKIHLVDRDGNEIGSPIVLDPPDGFPSNGYLAGLAYRHIPGSPGEDRFYSVAGPNVDDIIGYVKGGGAPVQALDHPLGSGDYVMGGIGYDSNADALWLVTGRAGESTTTRAMRIDLTGNDTGIHIPLADTAYRHGGYVGGVEITSDGIFVARPLAGVVALLDDGGAFEGTLVVPRVTGISPPIGSMGGGTPVQIRGENLGASAGESQVWFRKGSELIPVPTVDFDIILQRVTINTPAVCWSGEWEVTVATTRGEAVSPQPFTYTGGFMRGDIFPDGKLGLADAVTLLVVIFAHGTAECRDAGDFDDDGHLRLADAIGLLVYIFDRGLPPQPPFPEEGCDPTPDVLGCGE